MSLITKVVLALLGVFVLVVLAIFIFGIITVRRPFPEHEGTLALEGLQAEVEIYRDEFGIPHIYAQNQEDMFFAQGYVHAQDRFWQMEFWRHIGQGRISEIVGEATLESDKFIRTLGWNRLAEYTTAYYQVEAPDFYELLEAYSAGVNAYIEGNRDELSLNYTILGLVGEPWEIEPWSPVNTISWSVVMSDNLSRDMFNEIGRAQLIDDVGEATVASLFPFYPYDDRPVIAPTTAMVNDLPETAGLFESLSAIDWSRVDQTLVGGPLPAGFGLGSGPFLGSNNWAISGDLTESGLPLLANDPHLEIQMPSIWYEVGLHSPGWDVTGFSFAGVPGVVLGHNDRIAWGVTNTGADVQDVFIEKINPSNPLQYEFEGEWQDIEVIEEMIKVNGGQEVSIDVRLTHHGPIINPVVDGLTDVMAVQWSAEQPSRVLQSVIMLNQAGNYEEFREALSYWDVPSQNFVYADVEGNIAYQMPGLIPIRKNGNGLVPVPGWTGEYEWQGWIPYEELPAMLNPEQGYISTANNATVDQEYPHLLALYWSNGDRAQRINDMLDQFAAAGDITAGDLAEIQFDSYSYLADSYVPLFEGLTSDDPQVQAALERLRGWDLQERQDSVPAAIFEVFLMQLTHAVLDDDIGAENVAEYGGDLTVFMHDLAGELDAAWWDDGVTVAEDPPQEIILRALEETTTWFENKLGDNMNDWTWGNIHKATFISAPLGQSDVGLIEAMVNRGPYPSDGGRDIVNALSWSWDEPAAVNGHPSMRMIVDLADLDGSQAILPTGQSGHPFNRHYDDMVELWLNGQYHPMHFSRDAVLAAADDHLILTPPQ
ncbi:MAG: penicillin acylase family protein [Chloroflexota bacterium]|jgi:penicillin amidase